MLQHEVIAYSGKRDFNKYTFDENFLFETSSN